MITQMTPSISPEERKDFITRFCLRVQAMGYANLQEKAVEAAEITLNTDPAGCIAKGPEHAAAYWLRFAVGSTTY